MDILHISIAPLFFGALIAAYAVVPFFWLPYPMVFTIPWSLFSVVYAATRRTWHRDLASTRDRVVNFRYKDTSCFDPSDRPFVENNIETFLKVQQYVAMDASHEDTMQVFDRLVRVSVMQAVEALQSEHETKHLIVILCVTILSAQLDVIAGLAQKHGLVDVRLWIPILGYMTAGVVQIPLVADSLSWTMSRHLSLAGWKDYAWILSCAIGHALAAFLVITVLGAWVLSNKARTSNDFLVLYVLYISFHWGIFAYVQLRQAKQAKSQAVQRTSTLINEFHRLASLWVNEDDEIKQHCPQGYDKEPVADILGHEREAADGTPELTSESDTHMTRGDESVQLIPHGSGTELVADTLGYERDEKPRSHEEPIADRLGYEADKTKMQDVVGTPETMGACGRLEETGPDQNHGAKTEGMEPKVVAPKPKAARAKRMPPKPRSSPRPGHPEAESQSTPRAKRGPAKQRSSPPSTAAIEGQMSPKAKPKARRNRQDGIRHVLSSE
jgi:hypothetical protein